MTIPSGVKSIGKSAFFNCSALAALTIPSSVTSIGTSAFANCGAIRDVTIPYCVTKLSSTFPASYASITNVAFGEGVTSVKASVFSGCSALTSVTLPSSVTSIGSSAFSGCGALTSIAISSRVRSIGESAFSGCSGLKTVFVDPCDLDRVKALMEQSGASVSSLTFVETWDPALAVSTDCLPCGVTGVVYSCALTAEGGTAPYSWEITGSAQESEYVESREASTFSSSGTAQGWQYDDKCWTYALPFAFPFYGKKYSTAYVSSNGTLAFDGLFSSCSENLQSLTNRVLIAAMWDDLTTSSGNIYVTKAADAVTFRWSGAYYGGAAVNFAATLYSDGRIILSYGSGNANGGLVGISAGDGKNYLVSSCSQKGSLAAAQDVVIESLPPEACSGITLSEDGVLSGTPSEVSSNLVDVMVTDALGKKNHRKLPLVIWDKLPDGVFSQVVDGVEWCFAISEGFATVGVSASEGAVAKSTAGALTVPAELGRCPVTGIGAQAFSGCAELTSVVIPAGVMEISAEAFAGCGSLTNVVFSEDAPTAAPDAFVGVADGCTATVPVDAKGWDDDGDGKWQGLTLVYRVDPIPYLGENPTKEQIETALSESADLRLAANITNGADYAAYREWALAVTNASGQAVGAAAVKESPNAWLSFALGCGTLIEKAPERGDLKVESVEVAADGAVELMIGVKDIVVGPDAAAENLKRIFGLEGGTSIEEMSPAGVEIDFGTPENGKVKCTARPKGDVQTSFFMKARMDL